MKLTKADVDRGLAQLLPHFPEAGHNAATLRALSADWLDLLTSEGVGQTEFAKAIRRAKLNCRFFPKMADLMEAVRYMREHPEPSDALQISDGSDQPLTPEEIDRNMRRFQALTAWCRGELSADGVEQAFSAIAREQDPRKADCAEKAIEASKIAKTAQRDSGYRVADNLRF